MNQLIPVQTNEHLEPIVSARDLHKFLEVGTEFRHWFPRMAEYGFEENKDYTPVIFDHPQNGQPTIDFVLKIDMAKEMKKAKKPGSISSQWRKNTTHQKRLWPELSESRMRPSTD